MILAGARHRRGTMVRCLRAAMWALFALLLQAPDTFAQTVRVGGKDFTEQVLLAELTSQLLQAKGYSVSTRTGFASAGLRREQEMGLVDLYWEYTGTSLVTYNNVTEKLSAEDAFRRVRDLDGSKGLIWLPPSKVNNTYALAMRRADAQARGIASISDLATKARDGQRFRLACNTEFFIRPDGLMPMQRAYLFEFPPADIARVETSAVYDLLRDGQTDVGLVFATDGRVAAMDLLILQDDRKFFPSYSLAPVVRKELLDREPALAKHLGLLAEQLDNQTMAGLNAEVDIRNSPVSEVATSFLMSRGLL
jgi:osmoprotectant transport system substrate-binding protein